jgi:glutaredoxin
MNRPIEGAMPSTTSAPAQARRRLIAIIRFLSIAMLLPLVFVGGYVIAPELRSAYQVVFPVAAYTSGDFSELLGAHGTQVVMYSTTDCPYCQSARDLLAAMGMAYTDLLIDQSEAAKLDFINRGGIGVPLLYIGDRRIVGYREIVIRDALEAIQLTEGVGLGLERSP